MYSVAKIIALILCLLVGLVSVPAWAANTLLSSQKVTSIGNNLRLEIEFAQPMNYLSYFPKQRGTQLEIKLRPVILAPGSSLNQAIKDELLVERGDDNPVRAVHYEQDSAGNGLLSVQFTSEVRFTVEPGRDRRSIIIILVDAARQSQTAAAEKKIDSDLPIYVINLQTDTRPINADVQPVLKNFRPKYAVYTISSSDDRQTTYQLRLGYFHSIKLASENVRRLKPFYPDAWVDRVTPQYRKSAENWFLQQGIGPSHSTQNFRVKETILPTQMPSTKSAEATAATATATAAGTGAAKSIITGAAPSTATTSTETVSTPPSSTTSAAPLAGTTAAGATTAATATAAGSPATAVVGAVAAAATSTATAATTQAAPGAPSPSTDSDTDSKLMTTAKQAMISKDYRKASSYLTHILQDPKSTEHQEAQELLGLAYERMGLPAQARAEYEKYLKEYPTGPDADRVKQRLTGLLTAKSAPVDKLKPTKVSNAASGPASGWDFFGSFSQYYRYQQSSTDITSTQTTDNSLSSDLVLSGRKRGPVWDQRVDFAGSYIYDFLDQTNSGNKTTIYSMFYDLSEKNDNFSMRLGRQTHSSDGVLTRFDGITLNKRIGLREKLSFLAGFPVDFTYSDTVNTDRKFYALSMKFESLIKNLDTKFYFMHQTNDGMTDREAVGNETQYVNKYTTLYFMYDYDVFYNLTNLVTFIGNWRTPDNSSVNISATYRDNPLMTTTNALIGQPVSTLDQLRQTFTEPEIQQLALDRTGLFRSLTLSATKTLNPRFQVNGDVTVSSLSGTPASGGVAATPATGDLYYYNLQLVANNLLSNKDIAVTGLRYYTDVGADTTGVYFSDRFTLKNPHWRLNPRINIDWRSGDDGSSRTIITPRLITQWRPSRAWQLEMELGYQYSTNSGSPTNAAFPSFNENDYYGYIGYSYNF